MFANSLFEKYFHFSHPYDINSSKRYHGRNFAVISSILVKRPKIWQTHTKRRRSRSLYMSYLWSIFLLSKLFCVLIVSVTVQKNKRQKWICITWGNHPCVPPSPGRELLVCFLRGKSRSLVPRFTACPKQMGDSGNWHEELWACCNGSLSKDTASPPFPLLACRAAANAKAGETNPPHSSLSGTQARQVMVCQDARHCSKPFSPGGLKKKKTSTGI